jgi:hypothetical protein
MLRAPVLVTLAALIAGSGAAAAQGSLWELQVRHQLERVDETLRREGYARVHTSDVRALNTDESEALPVKLEAGSSYAVLGVCDHDCTALHLVLFNEVGYEVAAAHATNEAPLMQVSPREPGRYRVKVMMAGCGMNPCWYGVAVFRKGAR